MNEDLGRDVLQAFDTLLHKRPEKIGHDFSEATRRLSAWRDHWAKRWRATNFEADRRSLARVNAALSVVVAGQFPLGAVPWPQIEQARTDLADLLSSSKAEIAQEPGTMPARVDPNP